MGNLSAVVPLGDELSIPNCICLGANSANQGSHPREEWGSWGPGTPVGPTSVWHRAGAPRSRAHIRASGYEQSAAAASVCRGRSREPVSLVGGVDCKTGRPLYFE